MNRWGVFDVSHGRPLVVVPWRWLAKMMRRRYGLDYAPRGYGWETELWLGPHGPLVRSGERWGGVQ